MRRLFVLMACGALAAAGAATGAMAQTDAGSQGGTVSMATLIDNGYEIRAAAPNGPRYTVFLQKDKKAFACDFVTVTNARCGEIK